MGEMTQEDTGRPWRIPQSLDMEQYGMTGRSHTFEGVIREQIPEKHSGMDDWFSHRASDKGKMFVENKTPSDFQFIKTIGEGAFSTVYLTKEANPPFNTYAMKVIVKSHVARAQKTKMIIREKNVMALLTYVHGSHPFIVSLYCTFQDQERLYFALSYCAGGDLLSTLKRVSSFDEKVTRFYSAEIIVALNFIHRCGVVHRDLKPENILIKEDGHICLTDFGSAKILADGDDIDLKEQIRLLNVEQAEDRGERRATFVGTAQYVSPEMLNNEPVGIESDFWALGCLIYQMVSGEPPFIAKNDYHLLKKIQRGEFTFPPGFPPLAEDLVRKLLVIGAAQRLGSPTQPSIMAHPFYEGVNFETIQDSIPPEVLPYVPASMGEPEFYGGPIIVPGFDKDTMMRLERGAFDPNNAFPDPVKPNALELMFGRDVKLNEISIPSATSAPPGHVEETLSEKATRRREKLLDKQREESEWHRFTEDNLIVHNGFVDKKKGLFARRRMFLITEGPHIYYIDPVNMVYKGQIPICYETKTEIKNFRTFFVHTPERTYYLFDPARRADLWCNEIEKIRGRYFTEPSPPNPDDDIIEITKLFGIIPFITFKTTRAARLAKERKKREQKERKERTEKAKKERLAKEKEEKKERKEQERIEKAQRKAEKEKKRREKKLGRR